MINIENVCYKIWVCHILIQPIKIIQDHVSAQPIKHFEFKPRVLVCFHFCSTPSKVISGLPWVVLEIC